MPTIKTKVRVYISGVLVIASLFVVGYLNMIKECDMSQLDRYYAKNAELMVTRLRQTPWGRSVRGKSILSAFRSDELRMIIPRKLTYHNRAHYTFTESSVNGPASGAMIKFRGMYRIHIGVYHISELDEESRTRVIRFANYAIPEDEFLHVLIDELLSRYQRGAFFISGEASKQEELDAWKASEEAVRAYYGNKNYRVKGLSQSQPHYGPDNPFYIEVR